MSRSLRLSIVSWFLTGLLILEIMFLAYSVMFEQLNETVIQLAKLIGITVLVLGINSFFQETVKLLEKRTK